MEKGKGLLKAKNQGAPTEDEYYDGDSHVRYPSYDYEQDNWEGEEGEEYDEEAADDAAVQVPITVKGASADARTAVRAPASPQTAAAKAALRAEADTARERLREVGVSLPGKTTDEAVIAVWRRHERREAAVDADLRVVASACPTAKVDFEARDVELKSADGKRVAAIVLPDGYPEIPANALFSDGHWRVERFTTELLNHLAMTHNTAGRREGTKQAHAPSGGDAAASAMGERESSLVDEPFFLGDVCRFVQRMLDVLAHTADELVALAGDAEVAAAAANAADAAFAEDRDAAAAAAATSAAESSLEASKRALRRKAVTTLCLREWAALTGQQFTAAKLRSLVVTAKPRPVPASTAGEEGGTDAEAAFAMRRREARRGRCPAPKPAAAPAVEAVARPVAPVYELSVGEYFGAAVTSARETGTQYFTFGRALRSPVPETLSSLVNLKYLDLTGARATGLPASLAGLGIEKLVLRKNLLKVVPRVIAKLHRLRFLDMASNELTEIPADVGKLTELRVLDVSHNQIAQLCPLSGLPNLEVLDVTDNNLGGISSEVATLKKLWLLQMRGNPMISLPIDVYYRGIDAVKQFLSEASPKSLPVPPSTINEDVAYLHLQVPGNGHLRATVLADTMPEGYVPGGGATADDYAAVVAEPALVTVRYRAARVDVSVDPATGLAKIETVVDPEPRDLVRTFRWLVAARAPLMLAAATPTSAGGLVVLLPEPLIETVALLFAAYLIAPNGAFLPANLSDTNRGAVIALVEGFSRAHVRRGGHANLDSNAVTVLGLSESVAHWVPVACEQEQVQAVVADDGGDAPRAAAVAQHRAFFSDLIASDPDAVTFLVGPAGQPFRGHRSLFALRCGFFRGLFLDHAAGSDNVVLDDVDPSVFAALLTFLYTDSHGKKMTADNVVDLLFLSARYEVPRLRAMSECMVGFHVEVDNVCRVLQMAFFLQSQRLKDACVMFVVTNRVSITASAEFEQLQPEIRDEIAARMQSFRANAKR